MDQLLICDLRLCVLLPLSIVASTTVTIPWFWPQATGLIEQGEEEEGGLVKWVTWGFLKTKLLNNVGWGEWRVFLHSEFFCLAKQHKQATGLIEQGEEQEGELVKWVKWRFLKTKLLNNDGWGEWRVFLSGQTTQTSDWTYRARGGKGRRIRWRE